MFLSFSKSIIVFLGVVDVCSNDKEENEFLKMYFVSYDFKARDGSQQQNHPLMVLFTDLPNPNIHDFQATPAKFFLKKKNGGEGYVNKTMVFCIVYSFSVSHAAVCLHHSAMDSVQ